jgi:hypothetical protein
VASESEFRHTELLSRLVAARVDFVVVGGVAVIVHGSPRFTKDLDICYSTQRANLERLGALLVELGARLRGVDEDVPFVPDADALRRTQMLTMTTNHGELDLLAEPAGSGGYTALRQKATLIELDGIEVPIASIDDLIAMKTASGRPQDLVDLESLTAVRRRTARA